MSTAGDLLSNAERLISDAERAGNALLEPADVTTEAIGGAGTRGTRSVAGAISALIDCE